MSVNHAVSIALVLAVIGACSTAKSYEYPDCDECPDQTCSPRNDGTCNTDYGPNDLDPNDCTRGIDESNQETCSE